MLGRASIVQITVLGICCLDSCRWLFDVNGSQSISCDLRHPSQLNQEKLIEIYKQLQEKKFETLDELKQLFKSFKDL